MLEFLERIAWAALDSDGFLCGVAIGAMLAGLVVGFVTYQLGKRVGVGELVDRVEGSFRRGGARV